MMWAPIARMSIVRAEAISASLLSASQFNFGIERDVGLIDGLRLADN